MICLSDGVKKIKTFWNFGTIYLLSKFRDPRNFRFNYAGTHGCGVASPSYKFGISLREVIYKYQIVYRNRENSELLYDFLIFKICGILENLGLIRRGPLGVVVAT